MSCLLKNRRGQGLIEYLVIVALVGVATMVIMRSLGQQVNAKFAQVAKALGARTEEINSAEISANDIKKKDMTDFMNGARSRSERSGGD